MNKIDLENRLIDFSVEIIKLIRLLPNDIIGKTISNQLIRSGTSPALNYGEAQSAESRKDFIHKMNIVLKELRESYVALKIINRAKLTDNKMLDVLMIECNELISIFVKSVNTASNMK
ncbi:four helix bundle protein [Bacteroidota bacterium]